jgi:hypothetical protein
MGRGHGREPGQGGGPAARLAVVPKRTLVVTGAGGGTGSQWWRSSAVKIRVGAQDDVFGTVELAADGTLEVDPVNSAAGEVLGNLIDHYGESLASEGVEPTGAAILDAMLDRLRGYTWAVLVEP